MALRMRHPLGSQSPIALRARRVRESTGLPPAAFSRKIGLKYPSHWYNIESGLVAISKPVAERIIKEMPGMTMDYLFRGELRGMSRDMIHRLCNGDTPADIP